MRVSQINSTTNNVLPKRQFGKNIIGCVKRIQHNRWRKQLAKIDQNMQVITDLYIKGNPDIATKVNAVNNYVMSPNFTAPKLNDEQDKHNRYSFNDDTYEYLIGSCTNINEIYNEFGSYGLIAYAQNMLNNDARAKLLPKPDKYRIRESMVLSDRPICDIFSEYLNKNQVGYMEDLYQRFGKHGKDLFNNYRSLGFIDNGVDADFKETYGVTSRFLEIEVPFMEMRDFSYL